MLLLLSKLTALFTKCCTIKTALERADEFYLYQSLCLVLLHL